MTKKPPTPEELKRQLDAMRKLYGPKPLKLPKQLGLALALGVTPAVADVWLPMGGGAYVNERGGIAIPMGGKSNAYLMPDNSIVTRQQGGAISTNGTAYVGGNGLYSGTDGSTGFVNRNGDVYEWRPKPIDENPAGDPRLVSWRVEFE